MRSKSLIADPTAGDDQLWNAIDTPNRVKCIVRARTAGFTWASIDSYGPSAPWTHYCFTYSGAVEVNVPLVVGPANTLILFSFVLVGSHSCPLGPEGS